MLCLSRVNDRRELLRNERCAADQTAVHILLCKKLCRVLLVHRTAVLDRKSFGCRAAVKSGNDGADDSARLVCLHGRCGKTRKR